MMINNEELSQWEQRFAAYLNSHADHTDGSHDAGHIRRVAHAAQRLLPAHPEADALVVLAAAYFHDLISLPKDDPVVAQSSQLSAERAGVLLRADFPDFPEAAVAGVQHAIEAHSYSAGIPPRTIEAMILQDADRMEALGAIGIARTFYTAGRVGSRMFSDEGPQALHRPLNDKQYALDHFRTKLLKLPALMNTEAGKQLAAERAALLEAFMEQLIAEVTAG